MGLHGLQSFHGFYLFNTTLIRGGGISIVTDGKFFGLISSCDNDRCPRNRGVVLSFILIVSYQVTESHFRLSVGVNLTGQRRINNCPVKNLGAIVQPRYIQFCRLVKRVVPELDCNYFKV